MGDQYDLPTVRQAKAMHLLGIRRLFVTIEAAFAISYLLSRISVSTEDRVLYMRLLFIYQSSVKSLRG